MADSTRDDASQEEIKELSDAISEDGYAVLRGAITEEHVQLARKECELHMRNSGNPSQDEIESSRLLANTTLATTVFNSRVTDLLQGYFGGSLTYYPNFVVRLNRYTSWHIDNGFLPDYHENSDHLYSSGFRHLQCVIYLQNNLPEVGGGLDVLPGSHKWAERNSSTEHDDLFAEHGDHISIDSKAGDLVVFDGRLLHRGSQSERAPEVEKYGVFWSASHFDQPQVERYQQYLNGRIDFLREEFERRGYDLSRVEYMLRRYEDLRSVRFPDSFSPSIREFAETNGVNIVSL